MEAIILNTKNEILISQRASFKSQPLKWESNGGAVTTGESSIQGILRELYEELGLKFKEDDGVFYKRIVKENSKTLKDIWVFKKDIDLSTLIFVDSEVNDAKWVIIDELEKMRGKDMLSQKIDLNRKKYEEILNLVINI